MSTVPTTEVERIKKVYNLGREEKVKPKSRTTKAKWRRGKSQNHNQD